MNGGVRLDRVDLDATVIKEASIPPNLATH
jgi:hypothetical protein